MTTEAPYIYTKLPLNEMGRITAMNYRLRCPRSLVKISFPKMGKTLSMVNVNKILIGDTHTEIDEFLFCNNYSKLTNYSGKSKYHVLKSGAYVPAGVFETVVELIKANKMDEFLKLKDQIEQRLPESEKEILFDELKARLNEMPFPIFAVDTVTHLQTLNLGAALAEYNSHLTSDKHRTDIRKVDKWGGSKHIRNNFSGIKEFIERAAPCIIWTGHVKERKYIYDKAVEDIGAVDMALEGITATTFTAAAQAVGILYRKSDGVYLDFKKRDETDIGARCAHLAEQVIKIAEPQTDLSAPPVTHWDIIYPEIKFN